MTPRTIVPKMITEKAIKKKKILMVIRIFSTLMLLTYSVVFSFLLVKLRRQVTVDFI